MSKKRKSFFIVFTLVALFTVIPFVYAELTDTSDITVTAGGGDYASVTAVGGSWTGKPVGKAIGEVEAVTLFTITPEPDYAGDLVVQVNLVNTAEMVSTYQYLHMEIKLFDGALTPVQIDTTKFLSLLDTTVEFLLENPGTWVSPYSVKITGGSYRAHKGTAGTGETFSPSFYGKVLQR